MKILITGSNGLLGQHLVKMILDTTSYEVMATSKREPRLVIQDSRIHYYSLDITDGMAVNLLLEKLRPDTIIHCAALTQVDECEQDPIKAWEINVTATRFLVEAAKQINAFMIFVSTDFVFDGIHGPYKETDEVNPVSYYGSTKVAAEKAVAESGLPYAIVRTCLLYGNILFGTRSNVISWVKENLEQGQKIKVVSDQWRTPTYIEDLAKGILLIAEKKVTGLFHISGKDFLSPYDMAMATAEYLHLDASLIEKVDAAVFTQPAKRPATTGFIIDKAKNELGYEPLSFKEGLQKMLS
ncbi:MAG: family oxidoreductase [Ferruginibacter sp.]|uniref:dTDP-4-dehydrorhamnose reductase n=1 Tax=Ferruginibacter sp. TaxID=1940288 RepID=UPI0026584439|nr:dTDP-4-dehydrorhamnose reductase [Ferruginibacter sp.]MDB5276652.1 family oxidoreductase [Ferruginibacter sp.]